MQRQCVERALFRAACSAANADLLYVMDYDTRSQPVGDRVLFAGEHTNGQHPATATGAFMSGLREAQQVGPPPGGLSP